MAVPAAGERGSGASEPAVDAVSAGQSSLSGHHAQPAPRSRQRSISHIRFDTSLRIGNLW